MTGRGFIVLLCLAVSACIVQESRQFGPPSFVSVSSAVQEPGTVLLSCVMSDSRVESCGFLYGESQPLAHRVECRMEGNGFSTAISDITPGVDYTWCAYVRAGESELLSETGTFSIAAPVAVDAIPIEDAAFKSYLARDFDSDHDGIISRDEAAVITAISISPTNQYGIQSLQGIEYMPNLETIDCPGGWSGDNAPPEGTLRYVDVSHNHRLRVLNVAHNSALKGELDLSGMSDLETLSISDCIYELSDLVSNPRLKTLRCSSCGLSMLDVSRLSMLETLECWGNRIHSLDVSGNSRLSYLDCSPMDDEDGNNLLATLFVNGSQAIANVTVNRNPYFIPDGTQIVDINPYPPTDEIWYTTVSGNAIKLRYTNICVGAALVSNTYQNGRGVLKFSDSVVTFKERALYNIADLRELVIPSSVIATTYSCFRECPNLRRVVFAPGLEILGDSSMHHNEILEEVVLPDTVIAIEKDALSHSYSLKHIDLPPRLERLGQSAFLHCRNLESIVLPATMKTIGIYAFMHDVALRSITCLAPDPPSGSPEMFDDTSECPIYVPAASVEAYRTAPYWSEYEHRIRAIVE